jgi:putative flippase GtrA
MIFLFFKPQFLKFVFAGGLAAVLNFSSRILFNKFLVFEISVVLAYIVGMITAFSLNKLFVFEKSQHKWYKEFYYFTIVNFFAVLQTFVISVLLYRFILPKIAFDFYNREISHAIGVMVPVFTSFWGHKKFSFKQGE